MMGRARTRRRGFTVIEFVIASTLTLTLVATVSVASSTLQKTLLKSRAKSLVTLEATRALEMSKAFNCGAAVSPASGSKSAQIATSCATVFPSATPSSLGDLTWTFTLPGMYVKDERSTEGNTTELTVKGTFTTSWVQSSNATGACYDLSAVSDGEKVQPSILVRNLEYEWTLFGNTERAVFQSVESFPTNRDISAENVGGILVRATPGELLKIRAYNDSGTSTITRRASNCSTGQNYVWFPYLPYGVYSISADDFTTERARVTISKSNALAVV